MMKMKKGLMIALAVLLVAGVFSGCSSSSFDRGGGSYSYGENSVSYPAPQAAYEEYEMASMDQAALTGAAAGSGSDEKGTTTSQDPYGGHKVIRNASLRLETETFDEALAGILQNAQDVGGYVQNSYVYGRKPEAYGDAGRSADITLRVPQTRLDAFLDAAASRAELISKNEDTQDVTERYFDLETRLDVYRTQLERLKSILVKTDNLADIIQLESEISRVTILIEELTTELRRYDGLIEYSTVSIALQERTLFTGPAANTPFGERISKGLERTLNGMGTFFENLLVFLIVYLPVILFIGVLVGAVVFICLRSDKKRAQKLAKNKQDALERAAAVQVEAEKEQTDDKQD